MFITRLLILDADVVVQDVGLVDIAEHIKERLVDIVIAGLVIFRLEHGQWAAHRVCMISELLILSLARPRVPAGSEALREAQKRAASCNMLDYSPQAVTASGQSIHGLL